MGEAHEKHRKDNTCYMMTKISLPSVKMIYNKANKKIEYIFMFFLRSLRDTILMKKYIEWV